MLERNAVYLALLEICLKYRGFMHDFFLFSPLTLNVTIIFCTINKQF